MTGLVKKPSLSAGLMRSTFEGKSLGLPFRRDVFLLETLVAGTPYHDADRVESELAPGVRLELVRAPDNPHDPLAIEVRYDGELLCYVPRQQNEVLARLMDAGKELVAEVAGIHREGSWLEIRQRIVLRDR